MREIDFAGLIEEIAAIWNDGGTKRFYLVTTPGISVLAVVDKDADFDERMEEQAAVNAKLAIMGMAGQARIEACPEHTWDFEFEALYLGGQLDAVCRCGARRSGIR